MRSDPYDGFLRAVSFVLKLLALSLVVRAARSDAASALAYVFAGAVFLNVDVGRRR